MDGWRWVALGPALGAIVVWWIRRTVPESPRWLAARGRIREAEQVTSMIEAHVAPQARGELPEPVPTVAETAHKASLSEILRPPYTRRTIILFFFNFFQSIGFFVFTH